MEEQTDFARKYAYDVFMLSVFRIGNRRIHEPGRSTLGA